MLIGVLLLFVVLQGAGGETTVYAGGGTEDGLIRHVSGRPAGDVGVFGYRSCTRGGLRVCAAFDHASGEGREIRQWNALTLRLEYTLR